MVSALAFFPWLRVEETLAIGPLRLLPFRRGKSPGDLPNATQTDIDGVLNAYANLPGGKIKNATFLEFGEWQTGMDAQENLKALFLARDVLAFSALSERKLFRGHSGYCNYDAFNLIVQRYSAGKTGTFAFTTRRRDGGTTQVWSSNEFAFHRPNHVDANIKLSLDKELIQALLSSRDLTPSLLEALVEFNCANTDSPDVPPHVEVVMLKAAFEWLLQIGQKASEFVSALTERLENISVSKVSEGPLLKQWGIARPKTARPLEAWAREFCDIRGAAAHGKSRTASRFVWNIHSHLAFASLLFPLIFKKVLSDTKLMNLNSYDLERLRRIDEYLMHDPFLFDEREENAAHPWVNIDSIAFVHAKAPLFYASN